MFYAAQNVTQQTVAPSEPWLFKIEHEPGLQIRHDKQSRQEWYRSISTRHNFYTAIEAANRNQRASKDNPPKWLYGLVADFDSPCSEERVAESMAKMPVKPAWVERSLGGNFRLVWTFARPLAIDEYDFCVYLLEKSCEWLQLGVFPGLDQPALSDPTRLYCNGGEWKATGHGAIPEAKLQAFFVRCGKDFRFKVNDIEIPLSAVELALKEKYKEKFQWPGPFDEGTQGPSFWVEGSESPLSAIVKKEGMFTFSAHAGKPFFSWSDMLGKEFIKEYSDNAIAKATADIHFDGHHFWRKIGGHYTACEQGEMTNFFKVECGLTAKPGNAGISMIDMALNHIYNNGRIDGAAPFIFRPSGLIDFMGRRKLNTYMGKPVQAAIEWTPWGEKGRFPFLSKLLDTLFEPAHQKEFFLAWWKYYYTAAVNQTPVPGQNIFLMGEAGTGKTLTSRHLVGKSVGGFADASSFLIGGSNFNSHLIEYPLWCVDDETMGESQAAYNNFQAMWKKTAANQEISHNKKFEVSTMTEWMGRIICTTNTDYISSKVLGPMDNSSADKTCIFRCGAGTRSLFTTRAEIAGTIEQELPYFLRWLLAWEPPEHVTRDSRYGYAAYHEKTLLDQAHQGSKSTPFKELLLEALDQWFIVNPNEREFRGTVTQITRLLMWNPTNEHMIRAIRMEQSARYLEMIQRENLLKCSVETCGEEKTRTWIFYRRGASANSTLPPTPPQIEKL